MSEAAAAPAPVAAPATTASAPATGAETPNTAAPNAAPAKPSEQELPEFVNVKVNGKMVRMSRQDLLDRASLASTAHQRLQEAAEIRRKADEKASKFSNPRDAVKYLMSSESGLDPEQAREAFEEWYYENKVQRDQMTPEQRRMADLEARVKAYDDEKAMTAKQKADQEKFDAEKKETDEAISNVSRQIIEVIESSKMPKTRFSQARIAYWIKANNAKGVDAPNELLVQQVKKEAKDIITSQCSELKGQDLVDYLGDEVVKELRNYDLQRLRQRRQQPPANQHEQPPASQDDGDISMSEVSRRLYRVR